MVDRSGWLDQARCKGMDPNEFFKMESQSQIARQTCAGCPVKAQCLEFALADRSLQGYIGGTTDAQREAMSGTLYRNRLRVTA